MNPRPPDFPSARAGTGRLGDYESGAPTRLSYPGSSKIGGGKGLKEMGGSPTITIKNWAGVQRYIYVVLKVLWMERTLEVHVAGKSSLHEARVDVQKDVWGVRHVHDGHNPAVPIIRRIIDIKNNAAGRLQDPI